MVGDVIDVEGAYGDDYLGGGNDAGPEHFNFFTEKQKAAWFASEEKKSSFVKAQLKKFHQILLADGRFYSMSKETRQGLMHEREKMCLAAIRRKERKDHDKAQKKGGKNGRSKNKSDHSILN